MWEMEEYKGRGCRRIGGGVNGGRGKEGYERAGTARPVTIRSILYIHRNAMTSAREVEEGREEETRSREAKSEAGIKGE